ncbi:hypothetical protein BGX27_000780 [Mortierella sp. AM989]|nr:hypothetical protein BGX27_000780 [Mortierella sp. AM989]
MTVIVAATTKTLAAAIFDHYGGSSGTEVMVVVKAASLISEDEVDNNNDTRGRFYHEVPLKAAPRRQPLASFALRRLPRLSNARFMNPNYSATTNNSFQRPSLNINFHSLSRQLSTVTSTPETWIVKPEARLEELKNLAIKPYPRYQPPKVPVVQVRDIISNYQDILENGTRDENKKVSVSGRIYSKRESSSKLVWFDLVQDGQPIQAVFNRKNYSGSDQEFELAARTYQRGDIIQVETPILSTQAGGANAKPFATHANALDMDMNMRVAPELYLKQLVIGGIDRVYELGKQFRNEGIDADHNPEFTTCEFYQAYENLEGLFEMTEDMLQEMAKDVTGSTKILASVSKDDTVELSFEKPFRRINIMENLEKKLGIVLPDLESEPVAELLEICKTHRVFVSTPHTVPRIMDKLISHFIEPECIQPTFLWGHPIIMSPLAKDIKLDSGRTVAGRFELFVAGKEIVNAYEELNDPVQQRDRFMKQQSDKDNGDEEAQPMDLAFCNALEYGLPPTAGWGMGVDRVCQILTGSSHIRDVLAFPTMRTLKA